MKGIWGQYSTNSKEDTLRGILNAMNVSPGEHIDFLTGKSGGLAHNDQDGTKGSCYDEIILLVSGQPFIRSEENEEYVKLSASEIIERYRSQGEKSFHALSGHFSFALIDERNYQAYLVVDHLATQPLFYSIQKSEIVFASHIDSIRSHPKVSGNDIDPQAVFNYLYFHMVPGVNTMYPSIKSIPAGHYLHWNRGDVTICPHWQLKFREDVNASFELLQQRFKSAIRGAVERASEDKTTGAFLSGGTDSSTVSGFLGEVTGKPAKTYSIGFAAEDYDETEYARLTSRHFKTEHHEYNVTPDDVVAAIPSIAKMYDQPFGNASAVPTYYCAKLAKDDGIDRLLGGDGGDELFAGNTRYAKQRVFSLYDEIPFALRKALIEPAIKITPFVDKIPPLRKVKSYIHQASIPMPERMESYNLLNRLSPERIFSRDFLEQIDTGNPLCLLQDTYNNAHANTQLNRMLALDIKFTLTDNDLPKVTRMCELAGVDSAFPLLDDELIDFSSSLSPQMKLKGNQLRYFFKRALADFLPAEVLTKKKHGFGLPFGVWMEDHPRLHKISHDSLQELRGRNIISPRFIDELQGDLVRAHPGYYGTLIWVLMMLEQWFQQHHVDQ
ncbi:MAG TPA: asparagine synthase [Gammaproteobacteria bacterium]|nr:asparagine synthase [Gammaproteobacteria bacterium]